MIPTGSKGLIAYVLAALLCAASPAPAQTTVTLDVTADTYLRSGSANQNQGGETLLSLQDNRRGLVRVDQSYVLEQCAFTGLSQPGEHHHRQLPQRPHQPRRDFSRND